MKVTFKIPGEIVPWARAGQFKGRTFTPHRQRKYAQAIRAAAQEAQGDLPPFDGPVQMVVAAIYPWPKGATKARRSASDGGWKFTRPDDDNIAKIAKDAVQPPKDGSWRGLIADDAQCARTIVMKLFGNRPGLTVELSSLAGVAAPVC